MLGLIKSPMGLSTFNTVDNFFDDLFSSFTTPNNLMRMPSANVYSKNDRELVVEIEAPGYDRDNIEVSVDNGVLEIRGEQSEKEEHKDEKRSYMIRESNSSFVRRFNLPDGADGDNIIATLDKGVLKLTVPVQRTEAKRIEIEAPKRSGRLS